ncbi:MAG: hypothetical protein MSA61_09730 [Coriobacteriaceae bacterium]|nr:hypothetical protein [Coriobacteriaceae bacterium]
MGISDERREVAERLRQMAEKHSAVEASRVAHALGLEYEVHGTVVAFGSDAVQALADLMDPTCHDASPQAWGAFECSECGAQTWYQSIETRPNYCPHCGVRMVEGGDA